MKTLSDKIQNRIAEKAVMPKNWLFAEDVKEAIKKLIDNIEFIISKEKDTEIINLLRGLLENIKLIFGEELTKDEVKNG